MQEIAYLHVVINHLPIMGVPIGIGLLLLALWQRDAAVARAALLVFVFLGLATVAVYLAGQGGEDFVEDLAGVSHDAIEAHEEMAVYGLAATSVLAVLSLFAWLRLGGPASLRRKSSAPVVAFKDAPLLLVLLVSVATAGVLGYVGKLGGQIRHTEFIDGAPVAQEEDEDDDSGRRRGRGRR